jgi:hypothetical protein
MPGNSMKWRAIFSTTNFAFIAYASELFWILDVSKKELEEIPGAGFTVEGPGRRSPAGRQGAAVGARISPAAVIAPSNAPRRIR